MHQSAFDALGSAVVVLQRDGTINGSNQTWQKLLQTLPEQAKHNYFTAMQHLAGSSDNSLISAGTGAILRGDIADFTLELDCAGQPMRLHLGWLPGHQDTLLAQHTDLGDCNRRLQNLQADLWECQTLMNMATIMLVALNTKGEVTFINPAGCEMLGYSQAEVVGKNWFDNFLPYDQQSNIKSVFTQLISGQTEPVKYYENAIIGADGQQKMVAWHNNYLRDRNGHISGIISSGTDITARHQLEESLHQEALAWIQAMDQSDDIIYLLNKHRRLLRANRNFYQMVHAPAEQLLGRHISEIIHPHGEETPCPVCRAQEELRDTIITMEADHPDNPSGRPMEIRVKILRDQLQAPSGILMSLHDLTTSRQMDEKLRLAAAVFSNTHDGVMITDSERRIISVNEAFSRITGYTEEEVLGQTPDVLQAHPVDQELNKTMWQGVQTRGFWQGEMRNHRKSGNIYPAWQTMSAVPDKNGNPRNYVGVFSDISLLKQSEEKLEHMAHHDPLTNLPNRLLLQARLEHALEHAKRNGSHLALLFIDLDRFKIINDSLGHPVGDELLQQLATRLSLRLRAEDTLARLGGDEFIVLLDHIEQPEEAAVLARDLLVTIAEPFALEAHPQLYIGGSIGISVYPSDGQTAMQLIRNADAAMYQAKSQGRNTYSFYTRTLTSAANQRLNMENRLRGALERGEFVLHYQPQVRGNGEIVAVEALVRWQHPEEGLIPPIEFISIAEDTGLIVPLGHWILQTACSQVKYWHDHGFPGLGLAVNISTREFRQTDLAGQIEDTLRRTGLNPHYLELEITESALMCQQCNADEALQAIKKLGVRISIDDFGTGYSSLGYLRRFPIDTLKIDRSFIHDIPSTKEDMEIAATIIAMAHNLNLTVLAEGVETEAQLAFLHQHGCELYQGYHFSRPLPAGKLVQLFPAGGAA